MKVDAKIFLKLKDLMVTSSSCRNLTTRRRCDVVLHHLFNQEPLYPYKIEISKGPGDFHHMKTMLKATFFLDEPSVKLFGLTGNENGGEIFPAMLSEVNYEDSLIARTKDTNDMVGFALNGEFDKEKLQEDLKKWLPKLKDSRNRKLINLWSVMSQQFNHKRVVPHGRVMEVMYVGVVPKARKQGLAKKLVERSLLLAKFSGYGLVQVACTNNHSSKVCKSLGMSLGAVVEYSDLLMPKDGRPFVTEPPPSPNSFVRVYYEVV